MTKISYEDKINIYTRIKNGESPQRISKEYSMRYDKIRYLIRLIDIHGFEILRTTKNKNYKIYEKEEMINRVLLGGESILSVSADEGLLSTGTLNDWIKKYKEMGYNIVERKRGRPIMPKVTKKKKNETDKEKIKRLEEENLYLKAELEY